ncbi:methyltransferase type 11 [Raphidocelis subcapitata]|uniref:Methyltransferase type 11 n=1 Tax=Raphidocelis subcapitata TaxID=307507 RepID=A0A2V0PH68_9CHLO|nr:methyltransferase type 11 [Raphidocelis subcapitata]|eukprot:GBF97263.1 methyltransferase type 11 [Raphidocelis subcapitata]
MQGQRLLQGSAHRPAAKPQQQPRQPRRRPAAAPRAAAGSSAAPAAAAAAPVAPPPPAIMGVVEGLFQWKPLFNMAAKKARSMIVQRGEAIGIDWAGAMAKRRAHDWDAELKGVVNYAVTYPDYYTKAFHAYEQGNLCWDSALEVTLAAQSVHAGVMDPANKAFRRDGDAALRGAYGERTRQLMAAQGFDPASVRSAVDLGCATGLSSLALLEAFPGAAVTGVDLSPYFLAVGRYEQREREADTGRPEALSFVHAPAEATGLPAASCDLVSMCLVAHELPQSATRAILREAYRLLKPGGVMAIMEMNPASPAFQRIFSNPFAFAAFKSTEPHLTEYVTLDLAAAYTDAGFNAPQQLENTPRHRTVVARKPQAA